MSDDEKNRISKRLDHLATLSFKLRPNDYRLEWWQKLSLLETFLWQDDLTLDEANHQCDEFEQELKDAILIQKLEN
jgi:hypothetical protein